MVLKAHKPWIEFAGLGVIAYFTVKLLVLTFEKSDPIMIIPIIFFLTIGLAATAWINKEYRSYEIGSKLSFKGLFWGKSELDVKELTGFKIKERKNTAALIPLSEYDILIHTTYGGDIIIRQDNYNSEQIKKFKEQLEAIGIPFLGTEKFSWKKSFKDLLKLKLLE